MTRPPGKVPPERQEAAREKDHRTLVLLGALCLFLSTLEYLIPKPLPFIRIGLANLPLLLALDLLSPRHFALLSLIKIAGGGIIGGTILSYGFLFSLGGSAASALVMYGLGILRRGGPGSLRPGLAGIGTAGALCSTGVQLLLARYLVFGEAARYLIPPFLAAALVTGFGLGLFCEHFRRRSRWYALRTGRGLESAAESPAPGPPERSPGPPFPAAGGAEPARQRRKERWDSLFDYRELAIAGFLGVLLFLFNPSVAGRTVQFLFFWFCAWASGKRNRPLFTLLVIAGVMLVNLLAPYGRVLAEIGPLSVTTGSLTMGFRKGITLEGLFMLSAALIRGGKAGRRKRPEGAGQGKTPEVPLRRGFRTFRRLLEESLAAFALLSEGGGLVRPGHFAEDLDSIFLDLEGRSPAEGAPPNPGGEEGGNGRAAPEGGKPSRWRGRLLLALGLLITALPAVLPVFLRRIA